MLPRLKPSIRNALILGLVTIGAYSILHKPATENTTTPSTLSNNVLRVTSTHPRTATLQQTLRISGLITPREDIVVTSELSQVRVTDVIADEGMHVEKGQVLAHLDAESLNHQYAELQANFAQAETEYNRAFAIKDTGAITKEKFDQKRAAYLALKAQRDDARLKINRAAIIAPVAGLLYDRQANIGDLISNTQALFRIAKDGEFELNAEVAETDLARLNIGQTAAITLQGQEEPLQSTIRLISPHIDSQSRTAHVRITLPKSAKVAVGAFGHADIITQEATGLTLPYTAIMQDDIAYVWKVSADKSAHKIPVTVGIRSGERVQVISDALTEKDEIIAKSGVFLNEGDKVVIVPSPEAQIPLATPSTTEKKP
jgi:HlyD family secretion protein